MKNIAIFASGRGSNFTAIAQAAKKGMMGARIAAVICDNPNAGVIDRAKKENIKVIIVCREDFPSKKDFESAIMARLKAERVDLIVLAGFMRILSPEFVKQFRNKIVNIHPALLPAFKGSEGIKDAFKYGVKVTGVTVHFVDEKMDHGPIIAQASVCIRPTDTLKSCEERIHSLEHILYPWALNVVLGGKFRMAGRVVKISPRLRPLVLPHDLR